MNTTYGTDLQVRDLTIDQFGFGPAQSLNDLGDGSLSG